MSTTVNNNNSNNSNNSSGSNKTAAFSLNEVNVCADCGQTDPTWASINHGVLVCDQCAIIHRSLGRFISQIKSLKATNWRPSQLQMVVDLHRTGANSIWEHTLLDPHLLLLKGFPNSSSSSSPLSSSSSSNHHHNHHRNHQQQKKPQPGDPLHPTKSDFIRAKYLHFAYVNKAHHHHGGGGAAHHHHHSQNAGSKGATVDEDAESEADFSEQLHSSVRTPNLKTSLRLLVAGANPNYIHSEKFNSPLHMAAKSGQSSQIELLLVYGANLAALDARGKTAIDYAREAGHLELVHRLIEHQFDLTDSLTRYLCLGRTPNHLAGEHFLVVDIRPECLNSSDVSAEGQRDPKAANAAFRAELHASLQSLSASSFQELTRDIYDEIDRREVNAFVAGHYGKGKEKTQLEKAHQQLLLPFLPVYQCFSSTRNQGRQKLALLNTKEFTLLIVDVLNEIRHRVYGFASASVGSLKGMMEGYTNVTGKTVTSTDETFDEDNDSEPLYDSVPSEGDYDECNEIVVPRGGGGVPQQQQLQNQPNQDHNSLRASSTTLITNSSKSADSQQNACYVSQNEVALLKEQMLRSATLMEQFVAENREMRGEMARLQATVERLVEENAQLKGLQLLQQQQQQTMMMVNQNNQSYLHQNSSSSTSLNFLEHQQQQLKSNSMHFDDPALQQQLQLQRNSFLRASGSRVRPQSTATTNSFQGGGVVNNASSANSISGGIQNQQQPMVNRYSNECISSSSLNHKTTPPMLSSNQSSNSSLLNYQIQAQQQQQQQSFPAPPPPPFPLSNQSLSSSSNPNQQQQQFSAHSSSSSLSSPSQIPTLQQHPNQQQQQQSLPYLGSVAAAVEQLNAAHHQQLQFNSGGNNNVSNNNVVIATSTTGVGLSQLPPTPAINTTTASSFPSKEDVIKKIEFITNSIKELLSNAREGKHDEFSVCSERICNYVDEMISLFPESFGSGKTAENVLQVNQALMVLQENAIRLHEECNSYELNALLGIVPKPLPSGKNSLQNSSQDYRFIYNSVIDKAAEVASSVKVIVGHYSC